MENIVYAISMPELVSAADANLKADAYLTSTINPDSQFIDDSELTGIIEPPGGAILRASFPPEQTGEKIQQVLQRFRSKGCLPMTWIVSPASQPADLGLQLKAQGFRLHAPYPVMAVPLRALGYHQALPDGFVIEHIQDFAWLRQWAEVLLAENRISESGVEELSEILKGIGFGSEAPLQLFVGLLNGRPVATSRLWCAGGVAGIYQVITLPDVRGKGFGTAMTLTAAHAGLEMGYQVSLLFSTAKGYGVYRRLGFLEYYHNDVYISLE